MHSILIYMWIKNIVLNEKRNNCHYCLKTGGFQVLCKFISRYCCFGFFCSPWKWECPPQRGLFSALFSSLIWPGAPIRHHFHTLDLFCLPGNSLNVSPISPPLPREATTQTAAAISGPSCQHVCWAAYLFKPAVGPGGPARSSPGGLPDLFENPFTPGH